MSTKSPAKRVKSPRSSSRKSLKRSPPRTARLGKYPATPDEKLLYKDHDIKKIVDQFNKTTIVDLQNKFSNEGISTEFLRTKRDYINRYLGIMSLNPPETPLKMTQKEENIVLNPEDSTLRRSL